MWPDEPDKMDTLCNYIRGYIHTFRKAFALVSPYPLIETAANVCAMTKLNCSELAKKEIAHATKNPTAEEFPSLQKLMLSDSSLLRKTRFDEG